MAKKRMFDISVIGSDNFMEMPDSAQVLYFYLSMYADDDGFVDKWKSIVRMTGKKEDDIKILISKAFLIPFESGVMVIKHWRMNNFLRKDRHIDTIYKQELSYLSQDENGAYNLIGQPMVNQRLTNGQPSIEKKRIEEKRIEEYSIEKEYEEKQLLLQCNTDVTKCNTEKDKREKPVVKINFDGYVETYNRICFSLPKIKVITDKRKTSIRKFSKEFNFEQFTTICEKANSSNFLTGKNDRNWKADFDFLMRIDKATAILEGKYDNLGNKTSGDKLLDMINGGVFDE